MDILQELEKLHWDFEKEADSIYNRYWGKRMRQDDMLYINNLMKRLTQYSNRIYEVRQSLINGE